MTRVLPFDRSDVILLLPGLDGLETVVGTDPRDGILARPSANDHDAGDCGAGSAVSSDAEDEHLRFDPRKMGHEVTPELPGKRHDAHIWPVEQELRERSTFLPVRQLRHREGVLSDNRIAGEIQQEVELAETAFAVDNTASPNVPPSFRALENALWRMIALRLEERAQTAVSPT